MFAPDSVSVPLPVLVSEPPVPPNPPPFWMTPEKVVERLLPPTARLFEPRKTLPAPSIEPAVAPVVRPEMSRRPVPFRMNRAVPPVALFAIWLRPPLLVVMVALPAVLVAEKYR